MTLTLVDWLQNAMIALLLAWVVLLSRRRDRRGGRVALLETWSRVRDPDYWKELLGPDDGPVLNEEPKLDGLPECPGVHPVGNDGKTCEACGLVLVK